MTGDCTKSRLHVACVSGIRQSMNLTSTKSIANAVRAPAKHALVPTKRLHLGVQAAGPDLAFKCHRDARPVRRAASPIVGSYRWRRGTTACSCMTPFASLKKRVLQEDPPLWQRQLLVDLDFRHHALVNQPLPSQAHPSSRSRVQRRSDCRTPNCAYQLFVGQEFTHIISGEFATLYRLIQNTPHEFNKIATPSKRKSSRRS